MSFLQPFFNLHLSTVDSVVMYGVSYYLGPCYFAIDLYQVSSIIYYYLGVLICFIFSSQTALNCMGLLIPFPMDTAQTLYNYIVFIGERYGGDWLYRFVSIT